MDSTKNQRVVFLKISSNERFAIVHPLEDPDSDYEILPSKLKDIRMTTKPCGSMVERLPDKQ